MSNIDPNELKKLEETLTKKAGEVVEQVQKALKDEVDKFKTITGQTNEKLTEAATDAKKAQEAVVEIKARMLEIEQAIVKGPDTSAKAAKTPGELFTASDEYKSVGNAKKVNTGWVDVGSFHKTAIINATGQNQPLVMADRIAGIITPANRRLTIRNLIPSYRTNSNLVEFAKENVFTNSAGPQFSSPGDVENVTKPESGITFTLGTAAVVTIAHWIPASRQVLADANGLADYINNRLMYGLKLEEETEILTGAGSDGELSGLNTNATAYNRGASNDTKIDTLLKAMLQVALSDYTSSGFVLNPIDWTDIRLLKDTTGRYLFSDPQSAGIGQMWGLPVVETNSQTSGTFLTGAFDLAMGIFDREDASIRVADQHASYFVQNMVAILCEERLALALFRSAAIVKGSLPALGT